MEQEPEKEPLVDEELAALIRHASPGLPPSREAAIWKSVAARIASQVVAAPHPGAGNGVKPNRRDYVELASAKRREAVDGAVNPERPRGRDGILSRTLPVWRHRSAPGSRPLLAAVSLALGIALVAFWLLRPTNTLASSAQAIFQTRSFRCAVRLERAGGPPMEWTVCWVDPILTRVDFHNPGGDIEAVSWSEQSDCTILFTHRSGQKAFLRDNLRIGQPEDAVGDFLTEGLYADAARGRWTLSGREIQGDSRWLVYERQLEGRAVRTEVALDSHSRLPMRIRLANLAIDMDSASQAAWENVEMRLEWNVPLERAFMRPNLQGAGPAPESPLLDSHRIHMRQVARIAAVFALWKSSIGRND